MLDKGNLENMIDLQPSRTGLGHACSTLLVDKLSHFKVEANPLFVINKNTEHTNKHSLRHTEMNACFALKDVLQAQFVALKLNYP